MHVLYRHFQFTHWTVEVVAGEVNPRAFVRGAGTFSVVERRGGVQTMLAENVPFPDAVKRYRDRALEMGREAGQEWTIP